MGIRTHSIEPDLFVTEAGDDSSAVLARPSQSTGNSAIPSARYVLPNNLPEMIKRLEDQELDRLFAVVLAEQKRRGRKAHIPNKSLHKGTLEAVAVPLTTSKMNAIRAAFKAGLTPLRIARQFRISLSDVQKALACDPSK
jgi:hypothetical protein